MNLVNKSRKMVTATVVAATIAWSMGLSALTAAAAVTPGTLIKASLPTVYYLGSDNKRYVFPNEKAYKTWYADFSSVQTITDAELAALPLGGNVTYRPGVRMVKITTDPKVYAVSKGGVLRWVTSEAVAVALYGSTWNKQIDDVSDAFFTNYTIGADINTASDFVPATETANSGSINVDKSLATGGTTVSGTLTAMLSASQPMGGTLPKGATGVNMIKVDVRNAGGSATTIDSLVVRRVGVGQSADFTNVYAYEGVNRLSTGRTINTSTNEATFSNLGVTLAAGETKTLWIAADIATSLATTGDVNAMQVVSISSGMNVASGLPLSGPNYTIAGAQVGGVTIYKNGTLSNVKAGQTGVKVAEFKLEASSTEDVVLNKVALYYAGLASREKITNLVLKQAGNTVATASGISAKDLATFVLTSPMTLEKGASRIFEVYADIAGNAKNEGTGDLKWYVDATTDVYAVGATYGYGVTVTNSTYDGSSTGTKYSIVEIDAATLNATFNGPSAKNIARNSKAVELLNYTLTAQANLEIRQTDIKVTTVTDNVTIIDNLKVVDASTGAVIAGPYDMTTAGLTETKAFTEVYNLTAGQARTFKVVADISSAATSGAKVTVQLGDTSLFSTSNKVRNLDTGLYVTSTDDMVPSTVMAGNQHTIEAASLTVSKASTPVAQTFIKGTQGVALGGIILKAGDGVDMKVSSVTLKRNSSAMSASDLITSLSTASLWNGATQVGTTISPAATTANLTFSSLNLTVPAGQSITLTLKGNLSSSAVAGDIIYEVNAAGDVTLTDVDGNSVDAGGTFAVTFNTMTVATAGTMTVALAADDSESEAGLVVGGGSNVVLAKYKFNANNEELKVTKVRLTTAYSAGVASLSLYNGSTLVGGPVGVDGSGNADFTGLNFVVPKDGNATLTVKANLNTVGVGGATTASDLKVTMTTTSAGSTFEARGTGAGSSTLLTTVNSGTALAANYKIVRKSKPTVTLAALPSTTLSDGNKTVVRFTVAADPAGDVALYRISADVVDSDAGTGGVLTLATIAGGSSIREVGGDFIAGTATLASDIFTGTFTSEQVIAAGTSKTYEIVLTVSNSTTNDSVISSLKGESDTTPDAAYAANTITAVDANEVFIWSDMSSASHALTTADWTNGYKVKTLPTDSSTISR